MQTLRYRSLTEENFCEDRKWNRPHVFNLRKASTSNFTCIKCSGDKRVNTCLESSRNSRYEAHISTATHSFCQYLRGYLPLRNASITIHSLALGNNA
ncbi:unnamed protein product [Cylicocyclus nassatus]|uniref:Uncharacterized protein n=1 Tax=Cylicocyclus nassatus TaxID=53992 RepID=A0AA36GZU9_CYLNA|nr:unnamed protein product [Cylicocyclus nassatus]